MNDNVIKHTLRLGETLRDVVWSLYRKNLPFHCEAYCKRLAKINDVDDYLKIWHIDYELKIPRPTKEELK